MKQSHIHPQADLQLLLEGLACDCNYVVPLDDSGYQSGANLNEPEDFECSVRKEVGWKVLDRIPRSSTVISAEVYQKHSCDSCAVAQLIQCLAGVSKDPGSIPGQKEF